MRILITGAGGMLGHDVTAASTAAGHEPISLPRAELDITDADAVTTALGRVRPDAVINCAAWTNVDGAESEPDAARLANGTAAGYLAAAAAGVGAWTVHVSSDYVFDGTKREPYVESDPTGPQSVYGATKLEGEQAVAAGAPDAHTVVRTSWLFGNHGPCFPATIARAAGERDEVTVVDDQRGCPTFTAHLAPALVSLATRPARLLGVLHVAAAGECTWFDWAREIVTRAGVDCVVKPGSTADLRRPAPRPAYSVMRTERGAEVPALPSWEQGFDEYLRAQVGSAA